MFRKDKRTERSTFRLHALRTESIHHEDQVLKVNEINAPKERGVYLFPISIKDIGGDKWGYIDAKGNIVLEPNYDHAGEFQENGLAIVRYMDLSGVIDSKGYFIVKPKYDTINPFSEGRATVIDKQGFKVIDESGKEITTKAYSFIGDYKDGRALIADTDENGEYLYGYLNRRGKEVLPLEYKAASDFQVEKAIVRQKDEVYALIGLTGKVIQTYPYSFVGNWGDHLLAFQKEPNGKYGYIDEYGTVVIEPQFTEVRAFHEGRAIIKMKELYGIIDRKGYIIIKPNYQNPLYLGEGRFAIGKPILTEKPYYGSAYAVADKDGHILTGFIFNGVSKYRDGVASAFNDQTTFFIDKSGKRINTLPTVAGSGVLKFDKTLIKAEIDFRLLYFQKNGKLLWKQNQKIPLKDSQYAVVENKYKPNKDYLVYYPAVNSIGNIEVQKKVNQYLKDFFGVKIVSPNKQLDSTYMSDFEITFFQKNLLVIEKTGYDYPFGAAHGMPLKRYTHINLKTGVIYQLKDLFKTRSQYLKIISGMIALKIKNEKEYSYVFPDRYTGIRESQPFFISQNALNVYFNPYEIAPYVAGFPTFEIPFEEIENIINYEGDFWRAFH